MSKLNNIIEKAGISQRELAEAIGVSPATMNNIIRKYKYPKKAGRKAEIQAGIKEFLLSKGTPVEEVEKLFTKTDNQAQTENKEDFMLLQKQGLFPETKRHFKLTRNPFDEVGGPEDMFLSGDIRYVRESFYNTAKHGGFLAIIGESGSGKSTLRRDLINRVQQESQNIRIIEPYVLAMEDNDKIGKTLKSFHIAESVIENVAPGTYCQSSPEKRFRQVHNVLRDSRRAGTAHCMIIEEAHSLPIPTLKHLKRYLELEDGFKKLLSIVLLGQPELKQKLSGSRYDVREVAQRCEVVELQPINGALQEYIQFRFGRVNASAESIITQESVEELKTRLTGSQSRSGMHDSVSFVYPLAVGNMCIAAMNLAAEVGAPQVTPEIINQV